MKRIAFGVGTIAQILCLGQAQAQTVDRARIYFALSAANLDIPAEGMLRTWVAGSPNGGIVFWNGEDGTWGTTRIGKDEGICFYRTQPLNEVLGTSGIPSTGAVFTTTQQQIFEAALAAHARTEGLCWGRVLTSGGAVVAVTYDSREESTWGHNARIASRGSTTLVVRIEPLDLESIGASSRIVGLLGNYPRIEALGARGLLVAASGIERSVFHHADGSEYTIDMRPEAIYDRFTSVDSVAVRRRNLGRPLVPTGNADLTRVAEEVLSLVTESTWERFFWQWPFVVVGS